MVTILNPAGTRVIAGPDFPLLLESDTAGTWTASINGGAPTTFATGATQVVYTTPSSVSHSGTAGSGVDKITLTVAPDGYSSASVEIEIVEGIPKINCTDLAGALTDTVANPGALPQYRFRPGGVSDVSFPVGVSVTDEGNTGEPQEGPIDCVECQHDLKDCGCGGSRPKAVLSAGGVGAGGAGFRQPEPMWGNITEFARASILGSTTDGKFQARSGCGVLLSRGESIDLGVYFSNIPDGLASAERVSGLKRTFGWQVRLVQDTAGNVAIYWGDRRVEAWPSPDGGLTFQSSRGSFGTLTKQGGAFTRTTKTGVYYDFDSNGRLQTIKDRSSDGNVIYYNYNASNQMVRITGQGLGYRPYMSYDGSGRVTQMSLECSDSAQNRYYYYQYDASGRMNALVGPSTCVTYFDYDASNNLSKETNGDNYTSYFNYGSEAVPKLKNAVLPEKAEVYFAYDASTYPTVKRAQVGGTVRYFYYQWAGVPHKFTNAGESQKNYFLYDGEGKPTCVQATNPTLTYYTWDSTGQVQSAQGADGFTEYYTYGPLGRVTSSKDALGRVTYWNYNAQGYQTSWTDALGKTTYFVRDSFGQMVSKMDRRGNVTYYTYDARGNHTSTKWADGSVRYYDYDFAGATKVLIDENGCVTYYDRDNRCRLVKMKDPVGGVTQMGYDNRSNRTVQIDPRGNASYWQYDGLSRLILMKTALGEVTYYNPDQANQMSAQVDALGNKGIFSYTAEKQVQIAQNPLSQPTYYTYTGSGQIQSSQDSKGFTTYLTYDSHYRKTSVMDPVGNVTYTQYDAVGNTIKITDPRNNVSQSFFDSLNRVFATQNALNQPSYFYYDAAGNMTCSEDALQRRTYFYFDSRNRQFCREDAQKNRTYVTYDGRSLTTSSKDERGNVTYTYFDCLQRTIATRDPRQNLTYIQYDANSNVIAQKNARGFTSYYVYDADNRKIAFQTPLNEVTYYTFDLGGNRISVKDSRGNLAYNYYDTLSRAYCQEDAKQARTYFTFDTVGKLTATKDPLGRVTYSYYDGAQRKFAVQNPSGGFKYFTFDAASNRTSVKDERGNVTYSYYDALNRTFAILNAIGAISYIEYDLIGNRFATKDPLGRFNYFYYDTLNRQIATEDALQRRTYFTYDASGGQLSVKNPRRASVSPAEVGLQYFTYDELYRKSSQKDELGGVWYFDYDASGNLFVQTNPTGAITYWTYDADDRKQSQKDPLGRAWYWTYDGLGNLATYKDPKPQTTSYTYDSVNQKTRTDYPDGTSHYFEYDLARQKTAMADPTGRTTFAFDNLGRMTTRSNPSSQNVYYEYDATSNRISLKDPDGFVNYWRYDAVNRMSEASSLGYGIQPYGRSPYGGFTSYYQYDLANELTYERRANTSVTYHGYDLDGRLTLIQHRKNDNTQIERWDYTLDEMGNIVQQVRGSDSMNVYWNYDPANRVTKEAWRTSGGSDVYGFTYTYDAAWNRTQRRQTLGTPSSTYWDYDQADQPLRQKNDTAVTVYFTYDPAGNLSVEHDTDPSAGRTYYDYEARNLLVRVDFPGSTATNYFQYNAMMERVRKDDSTSQKKYTWDGNDTILEKDLSGNSLQRLVKGASPVAGVGAVALQHVLASSVLWPHKNQVGTTMKHTDGAQTVQNTYEYDAWGQPLVATEGVSQQYRFTGKELDPDFIAFNSVNRRTHFPGRVYSPFRASFAQIDPPSLRNAGGATPLYLYVMANPGRMVDPDGRATWQQIRNNTLDAMGNVVGGVGSGGYGTPNWGGYSTTGVDTNLYNPSDMFDNTAQQNANYGPLQTWVCGSGAVYNYINIGGGVLQNPCQQAISANGTINPPVLPIAALTDLIEAGTEARDLAKDALDSLNDLEPGWRTYSRFRLWFGDPSEDPRREKVRSIYYSMWEELGNPSIWGHFRYDDDMTPWGATQGTFAEPNWFTTLTKGWVAREKAVPPSSQPGIIVHEMSHAADFFVMDPGPQKIYSEPENFWRYKLFAILNDPTKKPGGRIDKFGLSTLDKINDGDSYKYYAEGMT